MRSLAELWTQLPKQTEYSYWVTSLQEEEVTTKHMKAWLEGSVKVESTQMVFSRSVSVLSGTCASLIHTLTNLTTITIPGCTPGLSISIYSTILLFENNI